MINRTYPLLDQASRAKLKPLGFHNKSKLGTALNILAAVKFFTPDSNWTWYAAEFDGKDTFWGVVVGFEAELGDFRLTEIESLRGMLGLPVERDHFYIPKTLNQLMDEHKPSWVRHNGRAGGCYPARHSAGMAANRKSE